MQAKGEALIACWKVATEVTQSVMALAQMEQEHQANSRRQAANEFRIGDKVQLCLKNITIERPIKKLEQVNAEYEILEVLGLHSIQLNMPAGIYPTFHISLVCRAAIDLFPSQQRDAIALLVLIEEGNLEQYIEEIIQVKKYYRFLQTCIKQVGYKQPTWELLENIMETAILDQYEQHYRSIIADQLADSHQRERGGNITGCPMRISGSKPSGCTNLP